MIGTRARLVLLLLSGVCAWGAQPSLLARVRSANDGLYWDLQSFVCDERVERLRGKLNSAETHHIDTLTAHLSFENGREHYAAVHQNEHPLESFSEVSGAWSEGEFGTLLRQTAQLLSVIPPSDGVAGLWEGEPATVFSLEVPADESPWELVLEDGQTRTIGFHTSVWVSNESGKIIRVLRQSADLPRELGISQIEWSVALRRSSIHEATWLVPDSAEYSVSYKSLNRREVNRIYFSNYKRYGSEASIRYGE
jgi:hypothetical protein